MSVPEGFAAKWQPNKDIHEQEGYLRESYHGKPYATRYFVEEAFRAEEPIAISVGVLRSRLPATVMIANYRYHALYEQGRNPALHEVSENNLLEAVVAPAREFMGSFGHEHEIASCFSEEQLRATTALIASRNLPKYALAFVNFVDLAERVEFETFKPARIYACY